MGLRARLPAPQPLSFAAYAQYLCCHLYSAAHILARGLGHTLGVCMEQSDKGAAPWTAYGDGDAVGGAVGYRSLDNAAVRGAAHSIAELVGGQPLPLLCHSPARLSWPSISECYNIPSYAVSTHTPSYILLRQPQRLLQLLNPPLYLSRLTVFYLDTSHPLVYLR